MNEIQKSETYSQLYKVLFEGKIREHYSWTVAPDTYIDMNEQEFIFKCKEIGLTFTSARADLQDFDTVLDNNNY